jgi:prolyl-tRNA editing enzyme YbaK/EbsC (Cys-tRNA(Pro) deacylase)
MSTTWPEPVEKVARFLRESMVESRVEEFSAGTPTAADAAEAVGCSLSQIVKSLVFTCDDHSILVLVPGDRRADPAKVRAVAGCSKAKVAGPEEVLHATGFEPEAVAPFPLVSVRGVFVDTSLLVHEVVWVGAGSHRHMAALAPADLVRITRAKVVDATSENA